MNDKRDSIAHRAMRIPDTVTYSVPYDSKMVRGSLWWSGPHLLYQKSADGQEMLKITITDREILMIRQPNGKKMRIPWAICNQISELPGKLILTVPSAGAEGTGGDYFEVPLPVTPESSTYQTIIAIIEKNFFRGKAQSEWEQVRTPVERLAIPTPGAKRFWVSKEPAAYWKSLVIDKSNLSRNPLMILIVGLLSLVSLFIIGLVIWATITTLING